MSDAMVGEVAEFSVDGKITRGKIHECVIKDGRMYVGVTYKVVVGANQFSVAQMRLHVSQCKVIRSK